MKAKLVLIPGLGCTAGMYAAQIRQISDQVDCWVAPLHHTDSLIEMSAWIIDECPWDHFSVVGASMGGYVAFEVARQAPERVLSLGAVATMAAADGPDLAERRKLLDQMVDTGRAGAMWRMSVRRCLAKHNRGNKALEEAVFRHVSRTGNQLFKTHQRALATRSPAPLGEYRCPVVVAAGDCDEVIPYAEQAAMVRHLRQGELVTLPNCGHLPTWEAPELMAKVLIRVTECPAFLAA